MSIQLSEYFPLLYKIDPNLQGLPVIESVFYLIQIVTLYLLVVLKWGPEYMKNRPAYDLKTIILLYNATQVCINIYFVSLALHYIPTKHYFEITPDARGAILSYYYFLLKMYDLIETVIFVLRKKQSQVSFLHLYHHVSILVFSFFVARLVPGSHHFICGLLNVIVHSFMYVYYFFAAYDSQMPWLRKSKKYVTQLQLIQFILLGIHYSWPLYYGHRYISKMFSAVCVFQAIVMIWLFGKFYIRTYLKKTN